MAACAWSAASAEVGADDEDGDAAATAAAAAAATAAAAVDVGVDLAELAPLKSWVCRCLSKSAALEKVLAQVAPFVTQWHTKVLASRGLGGVAAAGSMKGGGAINIGWGREYGKPGAPNGPAGKPGGVPPMR